MYELLDPAVQYQLKLQNVSHEEEGKAIEFTTAMIRRIHETSCGGISPLMQELTGDLHVNQDVHQALYLKNLIGHLIGINHEYTFDRYTGVLYDSLIAKTGKEVLQAFFTHVTPQVIIKEILKAINNNQDMQAAVSELLISHFGDQEFEQSYDFNEENENYYLNQHGALK